MEIAGLVKSSLVDYPGRVACVLFVPGCNYNCFYCHNRALLSGSAPRIGALEVERFLARRAGYLDGAVISGGEPTLQPDLAEYIAGLKRLGYLVKLDSNGSRPRVVRALLTERLVDYFAIDYKAPAACYAEICGPEADAAEVRETIRLLLKAGADFEVRTTVVPQLSADDLRQMARELPLLPRYVLHRYRKPETYLPVDQARVEQPPYTAKEIAAFIELLRPLQPRVTE